MTTAIAKKCVGAVARQTAGRPRPHRGITGSTDASPPAHRVGSGNFEGEPVTNSDIEGIHRRGEQGRAAGRGYFDNPLLNDANLAVESAEQLRDWCDIGNAWAAG